MILVAADDVARDETASFCAPAIFGSYRRVISFVAWWMLTVVVLLSWSLIDPL